MSNIGFGELGDCVYGQPCWGKRPKPKPRPSNKPTAPSILGPIAGIIQTGKTPDCFNKQGKHVNCRNTNRYPWFAAPKGGTMVMNGLSGLGCACQGASNAMGDLGCACQSNAMGDLGAEAYDYKGAACDALGTRIDRLKANMAANPKRAAQAKYKTNLTNFTNEYNGRCGGSVTTDLNTTVAGSGINPFTEAYAPVNNPFSSSNPLVQQLLNSNPSTGGGLTAAQQQALYQQQLAAAQANAPFYTQTWFKVAAVVGVVGVGAGIFKLSRRKKK